MSRNNHNQQFHETFLASEREHILMISNHGIHQWEVAPIAEGWQDAIGAILEIMPRIGTEIGR